MSKVRIGLAACGVIVAVAASGCATGSAGGPGAARGSAPSAAYTPPAWAKSLGPGVTVTDARVAAASEKSPAGVVLAQMSDLKAGKFADICSFDEPSDQSSCKDFVKSATASETKSAVPTIKNFTVTYTAVDGTKALVGATGTICDHDGKSNCTTNTDPAALFDSGKSFAALWKQTTATSNSNSNAYSLNQLVKVNGSWYQYSGGSTSEPKSTQWQVNPDGTVSVNAPIGKFPIPPGSKITAVLSCPKQITIDLGNVKASVANSFYMSKLPQAGYKVTDVLGLALFEFTGHGYKGSITSIAANRLLIDMSRPGTPDTYTCPV